MVTSIIQYEELLSRLGRRTPAVDAALNRAKEVRASYRHIAYIAGALTGYADDVKQRYETVSRTLAQTGQPGDWFGYAPHLHGTDPVAHPKVTANEVRDIDFLYAVLVADFHINFLSPVAHGNAVEEGWAEMAGIRVLYAVPQGFTASRIVRGMHNVSATVTYQDFEADGLPKIVKAAKHLAARR